jgi:cold shock CspA family protein
MERPLKITTRDFVLTEPIEAEIREKAARLDSYYDRITGCEVTVQALVVSVPGSKFSVSHQAEEELPGAIREAFDAARRRLEDYARAQRRATKAHEPVPEARVSKLFPEQDYGFLETPNGHEIYFHRNSVLGSGFEKLEVGMAVRFVEEDGLKGPQASTVRIIGKRAAPRA